MIQLIYVSSAVNLMSEDGLLDLLAQSSQRNKSKGVTGLLLYAGGNFIQVLEGEQSDVEEIYSSILRDSRNTGNIVLAKKPIAEREFSKWSMGFRHLTKYEGHELEEYSDFLQRPMSPDEFAGHSEIVLRLLNSFKESNR